MGKELSCGVYVHPRAMQIVVGDTYVPEYGVKMGQTITFDVPPKFGGGSVTRPIDNLSVRIIDAEYAVLEVN